MTRETILLVDDEKEIAELIEIYLKNEGYQLLKASNGLVALELLQNHSVDLIILDVMMPHMDGIQACMKIREQNTIPIIMLSAKSQDIDKIAGLSIGADDYVAKPFNPLVLMARVKSQLRRYKQFNTRRLPNENEIQIDDLVINIATHSVTVDDIPVKLTPREFSILKLLAMNRGIVLSMEKIYQEVWNEPFMESKNTVMVHIRKIREKIEKDNQSPKYIKTVWGIGYKMDS
ncbi:response regulator transcription factor [Paenibacillus apiarius]|uniref:Response regulator transcription factor n=1 Tax=Paenibacillus apiarius TaxID=46240 RepID=A0ABT4DNQ1_9BACL|nr:response regulator transcription factor [Paenibacillus apiarius]MCY9513003.1 response regulator transcription factor [Paenibacillus apiarius]MCY9518987.1 response regulator transcription factor [Paenibacillus apiarius]MCY9550796.1 response regulator transcription factor [Paenibacillus apiarius]MCY9559770.1 response regulator transcription factor [Paenibacillus apiarius]MCY9682013.1 response regulator transcription factor [Paenibacillus apiarius]